MKKLIAAMLLIVSTLTSCNCKKETLMGIGCAIRAAASAMQVKTGKNMTNTTITHRIEKFNTQDYLQKIYQREARKKRREEIKLKRAELEKARAVIKERLEYYRSLPNTKDWKFNREDA